MVYPMSTENWTKVIVQYNEETGECGLQFATDAGETTSIVIIPHSELWKMGQVMISVADKSQKHV